MAVRITCINKDGGHHDDPHEAIQRLGWLEENTGKSGRCTLVEMVDFIEKGGQAYVLNVLGQRIYLVVCVSRYGNKYVKTVANNSYTDNLLKLLECAN